MFGIGTIGIITATYPIVWGLGQLITGKLSDIYCKKDLLFWGMFLQGLAILPLLFSPTTFQYIVISFILAIGRAIVHPTFLSAVSRSGRNSNTRTSPSLLVICHFKTTTLNL